jgi:hypothetical protein
MKMSRLGLLLATLVLILAPAPGSPSSSVELPPELQALRTSLEKYRDPYAAVRDGYFSTVGCVVIEGRGGMGVHFINGQLIGPVPDPTRPPILIYDVVGGRLELVAAEWFVPLATGIKQRPVLFGRPFDGPMEGHEPLMPAGLHHYDLHVWLFKPNPDGLFNATNPDVKCEGASRLVEKPARTVPHPGGH